jgi:hypothetical protein
MLHAGCGMMCRHFQRVRSGSYDICVRACALPCIPSKLRKAKKKAMEAMEAMEKHIVSTQRRSAIIQRMIAVAYSQHAHFFFLLSGTPVFSGTSISQGTNHYRYQSQVLFLHLIWNRTSTIFSIDELLQRSATLTIAFPVNLPCR